MQRLTGPFWMNVIITVMENLGPSTQSILLDSVEQTCVLVSRKWDFLRWRIFVASASSVLMLVVVVELCSGTEFLVRESESVDVFPIVVKASLAWAA